MIPDINLIPQQEVFIQQKTEAVKKSTVFSIILLVVAGLISTYFIVVTSGLKSQIKSLDSEILSLRDKIKQLSEIEISGRNLDKKYKVLSNLFNTRPKFSLFFEEIKARKPAEVSIDSLDVRAGDVNISWTAESYVSIAGFINNILNKNFTGGQEKLKELFTTVSLNSVSLDKSTDKVKFFIVVGYDEAKLRR